MYRINIPLEAGKWGIPFQVSQWADQREEIVMEEQNRPAGHYTPEVFYQGGGLKALDLAPNAKVIANLSAVDGEVRFVAQGDGPTIGVITSGDSARRAVDHLLSVYRATPLEVFNHFSSQDRTPPAELTRDHRFWSYNQQRSSEAPNVFRSTEHLLAESQGSVAADTYCADPSGGPCWSDFIDSGACGADDLNLFNFWFNSYVSVPGQVPHASYGANGISGSGEWEGDANVTLGPSSRGLLVACGHSDTDHYTLRFWVAGGPLGWQLIYSSVAISFAKQFAIGYRYRGYAIRQMRMTVRASNHAGQPNNGIARFFWGGSY